MGDETSQAPEAQGQSADAFIVERMRAGADEETIVAGLVERGADPAQARRRVEVVYPQVMRAAEAEHFEPRLLVPAALAGLAAAVAGGIGWALIAVTTDYEIGFAALGIGILAGYAVVLATRGRKGLPLQVTAIVSSLLGIALGTATTSSGRRSPCTRPGGSRAPSGSASGADRSPAVDPSPVASLNADGGEGSEVRAGVACGADARAVPRAARARH